MMKWAKALGVKCFQAKYVSIVLSFCLYAVTATIVSAQDWLTITSYGSPSFRTSIVTGSSLSGFITTTRIGNMTLTNFNLFLKPLGTLSSSRLSGSMTITSFGSSAWGNLNATLRPSRFAEPSYSITGTASAWSLGNTIWGTSSITIRPLSSFSSFSSPLSPSLPLSSLSRWRWDWDD